MGSRPGVGGAISRQICFQSVEPRAPSRGFFLLRNFLSSPSAIRLIPTRICLSFWKNYETSEPVIRSINRPRSTHRYLARRYANFHRPGPEKQREREREREREKERENVYFISIFPSLFEFSSSTREDRSVIFFKRLPIICAIIRL